MPLFNFATYADYREEWAIEAKDLEHARELIGTDPEGTWQDRARLLYADPVEYRDEFVTEDDVTPVVKEITPGHWGYRDAHHRRAGLCSPIPCGTGQSVYGMMLHVASAA